MRNERTHIRNIQTIWREVENITLDELSKQSGLTTGPEIWKQMEGKAGPHMIQEIGAGFIPDTLNQKIYDEVIPVENEAAIKYARELASKEGVLVGTSIVSYVKGFFTGRKIIFYPYYCYDSQCF